METCRHLARAWAPVRPRQQDQEREREEGERTRHPGVALYRRFLPFLRPYRGRLAAALLATLARPALNAAKVWLLKVVIDTVVRGHQLALLPWVCAAYLGIALAKGAASFADDYLGGWVGAHVTRDLRMALYDRFHGLSLRYYHGQRLGDLLTRLTSDISAIEDLLVSGVTDLVAHSLTILIFAGLLVYLDPALALAALALVPVLALASVSYARRTRSAQQALRERTSTLTSAAEEGLSAIALVKAFAREPFERARFGQAATGSLGARLQSIRLRALFAPLIDVTATGGTVLVVWFGVRAVASGHLTLGGLVVFLGYLGALYAPIQGSRTWAARSSGRWWGRNAWSRRSTPTQPCASDAKPAPCRPCVGRSSSAALPSATTPRGRCCATSRSPCAGGKRSRSSASAAPARRRW